MKKEIELPQVPKLVDDYIKLIQTRENGSLISLATQVTLTSKIFHTRVSDPTKHSLEFAFMDFMDVGVGFYTRDIDAIVQEMLDWVYKNQTSHRKNLIYKALINGYEVLPDNKYRLRLKTDVANAIGIKPGLLAYNTVTKNVGLLSTNYTDKVITKRTFSNEEIETLIKPTGINLEYFDKVGVPSD